MTYDEFVSVREAIEYIGFDLDTTPMTFVTDNFAYRGIIQNLFGADKNADPLVVLIECHDIHDTSGAGNDMVAIPISYLVGIRHDAKKHRLERKK